ncbi:MAG: alanyl-tRNA editing protein [Rhodospirillum sp.]|nr:alanyl-tRNA editing protein [Rhodospirillum sp.]MCF8489162.1 alanyl-tRNA editing protein [Rhodospirillum sp.]MCF8499829.1 alanyl-tRNA editing protein [Rhodospirillum sp.]
MERLFWTDPYRTHLESRVASVHGQDVTLEATIFFAESGGQESDKGTIGGIPVTRAQILGPEIVYTLAESPPFRVGDSVTTVLDWPRRQALMRLHFAAEIVLELYYKAFPGLEKIGAHIAETKARIDFLFEGTIAPTFPEILARFDALVDADPPIASTFSDEAALRRCWSIAGFAQVPCGGTHLRRAGEVGRIHLKRKNIGGGKERVEITLAS